jgi:Zn-dependent protease
MDRQHLLTRVTMLIPLVLSLSVHEWAHAFAAHKLGDDTPEREGAPHAQPPRAPRPLRHRAAPLMGVPFGWAKPVRFNPNRFDRKWSQRTGDVIVSAAGPLSNFTLALLCAVAMGVMFRLRPELYLSMVLDRPSPALALVQMGFVSNLALGVFNLLPIPPLDGSRIVARYVPARFEKQWESFERSGPMVLLGLLLLSNVAGFSLIARPVRALSEPLLRLVMAIAG